MNGISFLFFFFFFFLTEKSRTKPILKCGSPKNNSVLLGQNASMTCIVVISGTLPDFRWVKWNAIPSTYPNSLDFENGSYTLVNPVQYETVHVQGKYGVKVNIQNVTPKDLGLYTCYVSNHLGSDYRSAFLSERTKRWTGSDGKIAVKSNLYECSALVKKLEHHCAFHSRYGYRYFKLYERTKMMASKTVLSSKTMILYLFYNFGTFRCCPLQNSDVK